MSIISDMPIHQTHKQTELEKRLRLLKQQMYGKNQSPAVNHQSSASPRGERLMAGNYSDITYLRADLFKIATFSAFIFGAQALLYYLLKQDLLNINLF